MAELNNNSGGFSGFLKVGVGAILEIFTAGDPHFSAHVRARRGASLTGAVVLVRVFSMSCRLDANAAGLNRPAQPSIDRREPSRHRAAFSFIAMLAIVLRDCMTPRAPWKRQTVQPFKG